MSNYNGLTKKTYVFLVLTAIGSLFAVLYLKGISHDIMTAQAPVEVSTEIDTSAVVDTSEVIKDAHVILYDMYIMTIESFNDIVEEDPTIPGLALDRALFAFGIGAASIKFNAITNSDEPLVFDDKGQLERLHKMMIARRKG
ncbi:hypothetical protein KAR91_63040 [Candidatus Pacearchaeota archaeon]|nr:hypothetical protein [Candidatus Pacearchaeota archaeon]